MLCILTIYFNLNTLHGESPTFVRQEVDDGINDMLNSSDMAVSSEQLDRCITPNNPSVDISGISYISDNKFLNATVWLNNAFKSFMKPHVISSGFSSNLIYQIAIINSSSNMSAFVKTLIDDLRNSTQIDSIELISVKAEKGENFKIMFNIKNLDTKYIWFFTIQNNIKYLHSFKIHNYDNVYKKYLPIVNKIINSTEFIQYSNTTYANYENPYFGVKLQYPIESFKNFNIRSFFPAQFINMPFYNKWDAIFSISDENYTSQFVIFTKNKTEDFSLEDFKREMIELSSEINNRQIINYTSDFEMEKLLNDKNNYIYFKVEGKTYRFSNYIFTFVTKGDKMYSFEYSSNNESFLQNLPLYNQIINSTEFIQYSNTTYANYENPYFGVKLQYPINWNIDNSNFIPSKTLTSDSLLDEDDVVTIFKKPFSLHPIATFESEEKSWIVKRADNFDVFFVNYNMYIDVSSVYDKGTDYLIQLQRNMTSSNWNRLFLESSATGDRLIDIEYNVSDFYNVGDNFITFSLDLRKINNPDKYKIMIAAISLIPKKDCGEIYDVSQLLPIPPPNYRINPIINNPLNLYPNDEEILYLQIESDSATSSTVFLNSTPKDKDQIRVTFSPSNFSLNPTEKRFSQVTIITDNATVKSHIIPILAKFTFNPEMQFKWLGSIIKYFNPIISDIPLNSNLTITVEPVPPFYQPAVDFFKNVIEPFAGFIVVSLIPIISAIYGLRRYFKRKRTSLRNKSKRNKIRQQPSGVY